MMARLNQQQLLEIFQALKKEVQPYEKGNVVARMNIEGKYELWSEKTGMVILGKPRPEISFVGIIVQSNYVGFYFMPIYTNNTWVQEQMPADLMKLLKGKACFHIKSADAALMKQIAVAMQIGYAAYEKMGWI